MMDDLATEPASVMRAVACPAARRVLELGCQRLLARPLNGRLPPRTHRATAKREDRTHAYCREAGRASRTPGVHPGPGHSGSRRRAEDPPRGPGARAARPRRARAGG